MDIKTKPSFAAWLELKIPPMLLALVAALGMWALARAFPLLPAGLATGWARWAGAGLGSMGVALIAVGVWTFKRQQTTMNPLHPGAASRVVRSGVYRHTRNPMYLGAILALVGWAVALAHPLTLLGPASVALWLHRFQILPEERMLRAKFGVDYLAYLDSVPRWL